ncbi:gamma-butyrobetaine hydroxylase-like domain-containing protein [Henriciella sp. AS95]|uniref:gamma-butyrobetaine hydroxylase-like domain-containing protein n=1 Tax=Henriciella sp. AS95 TaxID=3135782 RepID=UPI0031776C86
MTVMPWPTELRFQKTAQQLSVTFEDEATFVIPYKRLREESPSAEVQGHGSGPKPPQPPVPSDISVSKADPVGRYAVRIHFTDGHSSGLYTWKYLRELGETG